MAQRHDKTSVVATGVLHKWDPKDLENKMKRELGYIKEGWTPAEAHQKAMADLEKKGVKPIETLTHGMERGG